MIRGVLGGGRRYDKRCICNVIVDEEGERDRPLDVVERSIVVTNPPPPPPLPNDPLKDIA